MKLPKLVIGLTIENKIEIRWCTYNDDRPERAFPAAVASNDFEPVWAPARGFANPPSLVYVNNTRVFFPSAQRFAHFYDNTFDEIIFFCF